MNPIKLITKFLYGNIVAKYVIDFSIITASYYLAYFIRFDGDIPPDEIVLLIKTYPFFIAGFFICNLLLRLTKNIWRYVSIKDLERIIIFIFAGNGLSFLFSFILLRDITVKIPRSVFVLNSLFIFLGISGVRILHRIIFEQTKKVITRGLVKRKENILIIGDSDVAASLQADITKNYASRFNITGFITTDKDKIGSIINATPIIGVIENIPELVYKRNIKYIFIATDDVSNREMKEIVKISQRSGATVRIMPTIVDVIERNPLFKDLREVRFEDYLARKPVRFDMDKMRLDIGGKTVLVTGGAGSVGSGLCRELIKFSPAKVIIFDSSENDIFKIEMELHSLLEKSGRAKEMISVKLGDIRNSSILEYVFNDNHIDYVIHAAALKHVSLSEENILETVTTNVCGTLNLLELAVRYNIKKFMYISTDKAVEPVSIMGATKRVGELLIKLFSKKGAINTKFMAVRFGNVIGSSGNVIEIFSKQLQVNNRIPVTDPRMERFFMSLGEATKLILQAMSFGKGGEIFILDMGSPVKIKDLARDIALFYGKSLKEGDFIYIGKRKGEKLKEKLFYKTEKKTPTPHNKIFIAEEELNLGNDVKNCIKEICRLAVAGKEGIVRERLFALVK